MSSGRRFWNSDVVSRAVEFAREMAVGAATPRELLRSVGSEDLRRGFPKYHRNRRRVAAANVLSGVLLVSNRRTRVMAAGVIGTAAARFGWRSRSDWGAGEGLPPGRVRTGSRAVHDPEHFTTAIREHGEVFKTNHFDEPAVCLAGMDHASNVFRENEHALGVVPLAFNKYVPGGLVRWKSGPEHDEYRRLFRHIFGQQLVRSNAALFEASADKLFTAMSGRSGFDGVHPISFVPDMVLETWTQLFFAIGPDHARFEEVVALYETIDVSKLHDPVRMLTALDRLERLLDAEDVANETCALGILRARTGDPQLNPSMIRNLIFTLDMTRTDVSGLLIWALYHAAHNSAVLDSLASQERSGAEMFAPTSLANRMVSETLRLEQSEHLFRRAMSDIPIGEYRVPAGWLLRVCTQESHRDPNVFGNPDRYDPDRFLEPSWRSAQYAPFGIDGHSCIGEALTRRFAATVLVRLASSYRVDVVSDGRRQMGEFQHWEPSAEFRIRLSRRELERGA